MSELRQVPRPTPILDAAEAAGGRLGLVARIARVLRPIGERIRQRRAQRRIDKRWHDELRVGAPEREDEP